VSGIKAYNDGSTSSFVVLADTFQVAKPGITGPIPIFSVGTVNGSPNQMVLAGNFYADGTIYGNAIVAGSITAVKLSAGSIETQHLTADSAVYVRGWKGPPGTYNPPNGVTSETILHQQNFTIAKGNPCIVFGGANIFRSGGSGWFSGDAWRVDLMLDGVAKRTLTSGGYDGANSVTSGAATQMFIEIGLGIGTHTIAIKLVVTTFNAVGSPVRTLGYNTCDLSVQEPRNPQGT